MNNLYTCSRNIRAVMSIAALFLVPLNTKQLVKRKNIKINYGYSLTLDSIQTTKRRRQAHVCSHRSTSKTNSLMKKPRERSRRCTHNCSNGHDWGLDCGGGEERVTRPFTLGTVGFALHMLCYFSKGQHQACERSVACPHEGSGQQAFSEPPIEPGGP